MPLDLIVRNPLALVDLTEPGIDLGQKDQAFDRVIERDISREVLKGLQNLLSGVELAMVASLPP